MIEDPVEAVYKCKDRLISIHVSDNDGKEDLHLLPFEGNIPWVKVVRALRDIEYGGPFVYEIREHGLGYKEVIRRAKDIYKELWR